MEQHKINIVGSIKLFNSREKEPNDKEHCLISFGGNSYADYELAIYDSEEKCFVTSSYPHPTGIKFGVHTEEGRVYEETYRNKRDRIPLSQVESWGSLSDLGK